MRPSFGDAFVLLQFLWGKLNIRCMSRRGVTAAVIPGVIGISSLSAAQASDASEADRILKSITAVAPDLVRNAAAEAVRESNKAGAEELSAIGEGALANIGLPQVQGGSARELALTENIQAADYDNGSVIVPLRQKDGSLAVLSVAKSAKAPTTYAYTLEVPSGGTAVVTSNQTVLVSRADGSIHSVVAPPWAKDAAGDSVRTHFRVEGNISLKLWNTGFPESPTPWSLIHGSTLI